MSMLTKIIIRVNNKPYQEIIISSDYKNRDLILEIERKLTPHSSFDFCEPLVRSKLGYRRGSIDYIVNKREYFIAVL